MDAGDPQVRDLLRWTKEHMDSVPNLRRLYDKMEAENAPGHYVHADYVRRLHECGRYVITDVEAATGTHDVDIQLDGQINIQVWYGMNRHGHILKTLLHPCTQESMDIGRRLGAPTELGGAPTDYEHDEKKIRDKLAQLPDGALGILLLDGGTLGYDVMITPESIPASKCILYINDSARAAEMYCSPAFEYRDEVGAIAECLGLPLKPFA